MAGPRSRLIDQDERIRKKPMRVLALGMHRTGTSQLTLALRKLQYTPHQMRDVIARPKELDLWEEAINLTLLPPSDRPGHQQTRAPYGREEFDKLLGEYDAVTDIPGAVFAKELIEAYPDAKVILTTRDYEAWAASMHASVWCLEHWSLFVLCRQLRISQLAGLMRLVHAVFRVHNGNVYSGSESKKAYELHAETIRSLVPSDRLLEIDASDEPAWEPLCTFLGHEIPSEPYPRLKHDEDAAMRKNLENAWWSIVQYFLSMLVLPGVAILTGFIIYFNADHLRATRDELILKPLGKYLRS